MTPVSGHTVQFYEDDLYLLSAIFATAKAALQGSGALLVVGTRAHNATLEQCLTADGFPIDDLRSSGRLEFIEADRLLASLLVGGWPDKLRFEAKVGRIVRRKLRDFSGLTVFGEMVDFLWQQGRRDAAIALECLWNDLRLRHPFVLSCAYRADPLDACSEVDHFESVCGVHQTAILSSDPERFNDAFFRAVREVAPAPVGDMMTSWIDNNNFHGSARVAQSLVWLRRYVPELASAILSRTRSFLATATVPA